MSTRNAILDEVQELRGLARQNRVRLQTCLADLPSDTEDDPPFLLEDLAESLAILAEFERRLGRLVRP